jgi:hypothetical protein
MARAVLSNKNPITTSSLQTKKYPKSILINQTLPFRVRFTNIGIQGFSPSNVPPIGLAVIGINNYIL